MKSAAVVNAVIVVMMPVPVVAIVSVAVVNAVTLPAAIAGIANIASAETVKHAFIKLATTENCRRVHVSTIQTLHRHQTDVVCLRLYVSCRIAIIQRDVRIQVFLGLVMRMMSVTKHVIVIEIAVITIFLVILIAGCWGYVSEAVVRFRVLNLPMRIMVLFTIMVNHIGKTIK